MSAFQFATSQFKDINIIKVSGSLDIETSPRLRGCFLDEIGKGFSKIICNLRDVDYISSAGFGVFINIRKTLAEAGGELKLSEMSDSAKRVFELMGFVNLFKVYDNDHQAIRSFSVLKRSGKDRPHGISEQPK